MEFFDLAFITNVALGVIAGGIVLFLLNIAQELLFEKKV